MNYSPTHVRILDEVYQDKPYPDPEKVEELALELRIPEARIRVRLFTHQNVMFFWKETLGTFN
jgi:hypothetical protein